MHFQRETAPDKVDVHLRLVVAPVTGLFQRRAGALQILVAHEQVDIPRHAQFRVRIAAGGTKALEHSAGNVPGAHQFKDPVLRPQRFLHPRGGQHRRVSRPGKNLFRHAVQAPEPGIEKRRQHMAVGFREDAMPVNLRSVDLHFPTEQFASQQVQHCAGFRAQR